MSVDAAALAAIDAATRELHLPGIREHAGRLATQAQRTTATYLGFLTDTLSVEVDDRAERRRTRRIHEARFPRLKRLADFNLDVAPTINPAAIATLAAGGYLDAGDPFVLLGDSGTGNPSAHRARHRRVRTGTPGPLRHLRPVGRELVETADERRLARYGRLDLLRVDELGYVQLDSRDAELLFQVFTEREEKSSIRRWRPPPMRAWSGRPAPASPQQRGAHARSGPTQPGRGTPGERRRCRAIARRAPRRRCAAPAPRDDAAPMDRLNPLYIPRNDLDEEALAAATAGELSAYERLLDMATQPYVARAGLETYMVPAPSGASRHVHTAVMSPPPGRGEAPIAASRFSLTADGVDLASFSELVALSSEVWPGDVAARLMRKRQGATRPPTVTLRRELTTDTNLSRWHEAAARGLSQARKDVMLLVHATDGSAVARYRLERAWPAQLDFGATRSGAGVDISETVTLARTRLSRVTT